MADSSDYLGALNVQSYLERSAAQVEAMSSGNVGYSGHGGPGPVIKDSPDRMLRGADTSTSYSRFYKWMGGHTAAPATTQRAPMGRSFEDFFRKASGPGREGNRPANGANNVPSPLPKV
jgi:hypothetical protein